MWVLLLKCQPLTKAIKSIESVMNGPSANDYFAAASYYFEEGKDLSKAKEWIDKAVSMNDKALLDDEKTIPDLRQNGRYKRRY